VIDLYQRHRDPESWEWRDEPGISNFSTNVRVREGNEVALLVNVSGYNAPDHVTRTIGPCNIYELTIRGQVPTPLVLSTRSDLERFTEEYVRVMAMIRAAHPSAARIHMFPAAPAPIGIVLGRSRLPKVDSPLLIYDRDQRVGGFVATLEVS
jgi:hypothetical protein